MISLDNLKTVLNAIKCLLNGYAKKKDIPTKLSNPNPLTFSGAAIGSYDGSEPLMVEIPLGTEITKTSQLENDSGFITLADLPVYNGEMENG